jgi:Zn-dependent protease
MADLRQGSIKLINFAGVDLYLHWSWFFVAVFEIYDRAGSYSSVKWNILEYLALFLIVMIHEYGHALACRQVGGRADRIVLWPLGGVAYVQPPPRPAATLWSIAAGPLVNVVLLPVLSVLVTVCRSSGWAAASPDAYALLKTVWWINAVLLGFNLLPIYPLDGGQILRSLLWFVLGRARSLMAATIIGFAGVAGMILFALWLRSVWFGILAAFILLNCWAGLRQALALARIAKLPRREGFACPACKSPPLIGEYWICNRCRRKFDTFVSKAVCPQCGAQFAETRCFDCGRSHPMNDWAAAATLTTASR